jgi:sarcosine oxidase subunit alpha
MTAEEATRPLDHPATVPLVIVGGGPAGLSAAIAAAQLGVSPLLIDDNPVLGGQLVKQTHKFFGSRSLYCGTRGMDIARILHQQFSSTSARLLMNATAVGLYPGRVLAVAQPDRFLKLKAEKIVFATGASENTIAFPNNDLPGIYGAGAVQTMMNVYGVRPGRRVLMVGAGNIGLIVSYQLIQAGIEVACVIDVLPAIGGYHVHAAKLARLGVPILTSHTVVEALGMEFVEGAVIAKVDRAFKVRPGTRRVLQVDTICLAVGLSPLTELLVQAECRMVYVPELGGNVAWHDEQMQTSVPGVYVAGDLSGIEEASTAMLEGRLAGAAAAASIKGSSPESRSVIEQAQAELCCIRKGPFGERAACGKAKLGACVAVP